MPSTVFVSGTCPAVISLAAAFLLFIWMPSTVSVSGTCPAVVLSAATSARKAFWTYSKLWPSSTSEMLWPLKMIDRMNDIYGRHNNSGRSKNYVNRNIKKMTWLKTIVVSWMCWNIKNIIRLENMVVGQGCIFQVYELQINNSRNEKYSWLKNSKIW